MGVKMGLWYCKKHKEMEQGKGSGRNRHIKLNCGCKLNSKEDAKYRISKKTVTTYYLGDGRELKKVIKKESWEIR